MNMNHKMVPNKLLQAIIYGGMGFVLGLIVMQVVVRVRLF